MKRIFRSFAIAAAIGTAQPAFSDVTCEMAIDTLYITPDGWILAYMTAANVNKHWWLCNTTGSVPVNDGSYNLTITSDGCKSIYSMFLSAKLSGKNIVLLFRGPNACTQAALPAEGGPNPFPYHLAVR